MKAEIVTIGDEILIGQIVDTNSVYISKQLNAIGVEVVQITSISDTREHILTTLKEASRRASLVLLTGGLGPTKDDITKHTLAEFFEDELVENQQVLEHVEYLFRTYITTTAISDLNRRQALIPSKATVLHNEYGTAPGLWMQKDDTVYVSLPGVPFEMKSLISKEVIPRIVDQFERPYIIHKTLLTYGLGESAIAEKIEWVEDSLPSFIKLAYLPNLGRVRLRLSARGTDKTVLENELGVQSQRIREILGDIVVGFEDESPLEVVIAELLKEKGQTLALAESCTGGQIAQIFTQHGGASAFFKGSAVVYATASKIDVLGIDPLIINTYSVTSLEVAKAMAERAKLIYKSDFAIATTGNAGPSKGDGDAAPGTVFIGIATPNQTFAREFMFGNHRDRVIGKAVNKSLELIKETLLSAQTDAEL